MASPALSVKGNMNKHVNKRFKENKQLCQRYAQINKVHADGNRKTRRKKLADARKSPKKVKDHNHWYKRIVKEMKESKAVQELVISGKVDKLLE